MSNRVNAGRKPANTRQSQSGLNEINNQSATGGVAGAPKSALVLTIPEADRADFLVRLGLSCKERLESQQALCASTLWPEMDRAEAEWNGDFSHRAAGPGAGIFAKCNLSLNLVRGMVRYMSCKADDEMFSTDPFFYAEAQARPFEDLAEAETRALSHQLAMKYANFHQASKEVNRDAWMKGFGIMKITREKRSREYSEFVRLLVDEIDGALQPVADPATGRPIARDDAVVTTDESGGTCTVNGAFTFPAAELEMRFLPFLREACEVIYDGPRCSAVHHKNFIFDWTRPSLEDNNFVCEKSSITVADLKKQFGAGLLSAEQLSRISAQAQQNDPAVPITSASTSPSPSILQAPRTTSWTENDLGKYVAVGEAYVDYEVPRVLVPESASGAAGQKSHAVAAAGQNATQSPGRICRLFVAFVLETAEVIWAEFLGNSTPYGRMPHTLHTTDRTGGGMVGEGLFHRYKAEQEYCDRTLSQVSYRNRFSARPIKCYDPNDFESTKGGEPLTFDDDTLLTKTSNARGKTLAELIEFLALPQMEDISFQLLTLVNEKLERDSGISSVAQGDFGDLPQNAPASGIRNILSSGSVLAKSGIRELQRCAEESLELFSDWVFWRRQTPLDYSWLEGEKRLWDQLQPDRIANLRMKVRLIMSRLRLEQSLESSTRAMDIIERFSTWSPENQLAWRNLFVQILTNLDIKGADSQLPRPPLNGESAGGSGSDYAVPADRAPGVPPGNPPAAAAASH